MTGALDAVRDALIRLPRSSVVLAGMLTAGSYLALSFYELLAVRYAGHRLSYKKIAFATCVTYGVGQSIGLPVLANGALRARVYSRWGVKTHDLARVIAFGAMSGWLGMLTLLSAALLWMPGGAKTAVPFPRFVSVLVGSAAGLAVATYLMFAFTDIRAFRFGKSEWVLPSPRLASSQVLVATVDWVLAAGTLYVLLPGANRIPFASFIALFVVAQAAGIISHVPGGLGVFDTIILATLTSQSGSHPADILTSIAAFRAIYYLSPMVIGASLLGWSELHGWFSVRASRLLRAALAHRPEILAAGTFCAGAMLVFSGAMPSLAERSRLLDQISFGPVTESAFFLGSVVGVALLFLSRGLYRRLDGAYVLALPLIFSGIVFSLLKGLDYEEATILAVLGAALLPARKAFPRRASLLAERFTASWGIGVGLVLVAALTLAVFSFDHVLYDQTIWWRFDFIGGSPLTLGATLAAVGAAGLVGGMKLLRTVPPPLTAPDGTGRQRLLEAIGKASHTSANLALVGDKRILFGDDGKSFLMYGISGRTWVAMGDPVGPAESRAELTRGFQHLAREYGGRAAFYLATPDNIATYVDLGFAVTKIGETALVPLNTFALAGGSRKWMRRARKDAMAGGCEFCMVLPPYVSPLIPALRAVSDDWLSDRGRREKGFSLGFFDESYISQCAIGMIKQDGQVVAFANLWSGAASGELSVDLMRYTARAPSGTMDYLLSEIMLWGKASGYGQFDLGMAPLAGIGLLPGAPLWQRGASLVFRRGTRFYSFEGVRRYKEKFSPHWESRYMATARGLHPAFALADVARLVTRLKRPTF